MTLYDIDMYESEQLSNKRQRKPKGQSKMDNLEKLTTQVTQDEENKTEKNNTIRVGHHFTNTNTSNVKSHAHNWR